MSQRIENLYRLALNGKQQFDAKNFVVFGEDLELTLARDGAGARSASRFTGATAGRGAMKGSSRRSLRAAAAPPALEAA